MRATSPAVICPGRVCASAVLVPAGVLVLDAAGAGVAVERVSAAEADGAGVAVGVLGGEPALALIPREPAAGPVADRVPMARSADAGCAEVGRGSCDAGACVFAGAPWLPAASLSSHSVGCSFAGAFEDHTTLVLTPGAEAEDDAWVEAA